MTAQKPSASERLVALAQEKGDFVTGDDGFVFFWPTGCRCGLAEWELRVLANELERRNADWSAKMDEYFAAEREKGVS